LKKGNGGNLMLVKVKVWGDRACFTRPEFKAERLSYDIITPTAAIGILKSIYGPPNLTYTVMKITVLNEISYQVIKTNEVKDICSVSASDIKSNNIPYIHITQSRTQRSNLILRDVAHIIEADMNADRCYLSDYVAMFNKRLSRGACYAQPFFGIRDYSAYFEEPNGEEVSFYNNTGEKNLGLILGGFETTTMTPRFFNAVMNNGVVTM
jgi:CRISPR-associated protein Cas5d